MEDFFIRSFSPDINSSVINSTMSPKQTSQNTSSDHGQAMKKPQYNRQLLVIALAIILVVSLVGNSVVLYMTCCGKAKNNKIKKKVNFLFANLAVADLFVSIMAYFATILMELMDYEWLAGDVFCRIYKTFQISALLASSNMIVIIALQRQHVIKNPLKKPLPTRICVVTGWLLAFLFSIPVPIVFRLQVTEHGYRCKSIFAQLPEWHYQVYTMYYLVTAFFLPFCILIVAYSRILWVIWRKSNTRRYPKLEQENCQLPSNQSWKVLSTNSCIHGARVKTLKMSLVIITLFMVCELPYFIVESSLAFGANMKLRGKARAVLDTLLVINSAINPYVYLFFTNHNLVVRTLAKNACFCCLSEDTMEESSTMDKEP
ncbi:putative G-protein coupled receptor 150 [Pelodytes ibericus]